MAQGATLQVKGYQEFMRACAKADPDIRKQVRETFRAVGENVRQDASSRFAPVNSRSAAGYKTRVRQRGIAVEQSIRKTTGNRPQYGALQMRTALLPALMSNEDELMRDLERAMDTVADHFERSP